MKHKTGLVFLSEQLKDETEKVQAFCIAREIAHVRLKHTSPLSSSITEAEFREQEAAADRLARRWLSYPSNFSIKSSKMKAGEYIRVPRKTLEEMQKKIENIHRIISGDFKGNSSQ